MKKYLSEIIISVLQLLIFYILPLFSGSADIMGLIVLMIISVFVSSLLFGVLSNKEWKYIYSVFVPIVFLPTVWIYYNSTALVYCTWFFILSIAGLLLGSLIQLIIKKNKTK